MPKDPTNGVSGQYRRLADGSVVDKDDSIAWFSIERFYRDICLGRCCFLCGASPNTKPFNDEHIIPDWLLRKHGLHNYEITLPNQNRMGYARYKVPCCAECNSMMGRTLERPISEVLSLPYNEGIKALQEGADHALVVWLHLIFMKTHLKDTTLRLHLNEREPDDPISSLFNVKELHHAHSIVRSFFTGTILGHGAWPSLHIFPCTAEFADRFDYLDLTHYLTMALQSGEYIFIMSLDDAGMASAAAEPMLSGIDDAINPLQMREITARLGFANLWLEFRPEFFTKFTVPPEITANIPSILNVMKRPPSEFGDLFAHLVSGFIQSAEDPEKELEQIRTGASTFLYNEKGRFINSSMRRRDSDNTK